MIIHILCVPQGLLELTTFLMNINDPLPTTFNCIQTYADDSTLYANFQVAKRPYNLELDSNCTIVCIDLSKEKHLYWSVKNFCTV